MNQTDFEQKLKAEGYDEMFNRERAANDFEPEHAHEFDVCAMVVEGELTITRHGKPETLRAGDMCSIPAGMPHTEQCGAQGVRFLAGRRYV